MIEVVRPVEDSVLSSNIVEAGIKLSHLTTVKFVTDVLLKHRLDCERPRSVEQVEERNIEVIIDSLTTKSIKPCKVNVRSS